MAFCSATFLRLRETATQFLSSGTKKRRQPFIVEASIFIPLGSDICFQIGYGYTFDTLIINSREIRDNKQYLILGVKKFTAKNSSRYKSNDQN
ncbi:MAG: hypothetical protein LBH43_00960 [Treponema sp.]|nr:hypothetical protein [Treponema sp.]